MKTGVINRRWLALNPAMRMDAAYWLKVLEQLQADGIAADTATDEQVKAAINKAEAALTGKLTQASDLRDQAQQLQQKARELEQGPRPTGKPRGTH